MRVFSDRFRVVKEVQEKCQDLVAQPFTSCRLLPEKCRRTGRRCHASPSGSNLPLRPVLEEPRRLLSFFLCHSLRHFSFRCFGVLLGEPPEQANDGGHDGETLSVAGQENYFLPSLAIRTQRKPLQNRDVHDGNIFEPGIPGFAHSHRRRKCRSSTDRVQDDSSRQQ